MGTSGAKPSDFPLSIQGGMLEALGINMYTTLGKCLVEFVANAYDSEASEVSIAIPLEAIAEARAKVRAAAKTEVAEGTRDPFRTLLTPLPDGVEVVIEDNGHGMSPSDIENKFLPINRKRRLDASGDETRLKSETGRRMVMGRKGLGKLAGFGAATRVRIRSKREGETFATTIVMDYAELGASDNISQVRIPATYEEGLPAEGHGTRITLSGLKSDAVKSSISSIEHTLREAFFGIEPSELLIKVNEVTVEPEKPVYEFVYPEGASPESPAKSTFAIEDLGDIEFSYYVGFRDRGEHLPAAQRGARIYCNNRLAAGPSLFGLPTGMHNFHSQSYMECVVRADELDRHGVDFVNTNRTQLREDNEVVRALIERIEEEMRKALVAHAHYREGAAERAIETEADTAVYVRILARMPTRTRTSAKRLLRSLAVQHGTKSPEFIELAPLVIDTMNAGDVLIRLSELGHDPQSLAQIAGHLRELADIEKNDALKLYRGRRSGIRALLELVDRSEHELWKKKRVEKELHALLKEEPWLIKPEYSRYLTSDESMEKVASALAKHLGVDAFAPFTPEGEEPDATRPDLVFVMADSASPHVINVVELKSPSIPLTMDHLNQLKTYMLKLKRYVQQELKRAVTVHGYLIGAYPAPDTKNDDELLLLDEIERAGPESDWMVLGVRSLLERANQIHGDAIDALKSDLDEPDAPDDKPAALPLPSLALASPESV